MCNCNDRNDNQLQHDKQDEFWRLLIKKYEERNRTLQNKKDLLQKCNNEMEAWMPAYLNYKMFQLKNTNPDANINKLFHLPCKCNLFPKREEPKIVDLSSVSAFSLQPTDLNYMKVIKNLATHEHDLTNQVNRLRNKDKFLKECKLKVDRMLLGGGGGEDSTKPISIDQQQLIDFKERFMQSNQLLEEELVGLRNELLELRNKTLEMQSTIEKEQRLSDELTESLNKSATNKTAGVPNMINTLRSDIERNSKELEKEMVDNEKLKTELNSLSKQKDALVEQLISKKTKEYSDSLSKKELKSAI